MTLALCSLAEFKVRIKDRDGENISDKEILLHMDRYVFVTEVKCSFTTRGDCPFHSIINLAFGVDLFIAENGSGLNVAERLSLVAGLTVTIIYMLPIYEYSYAVNDVQKALKNMEENNWFFLRDFSKPLLVIDSIDLLDSHCFCDRTLFANDRKTEFWSRFSLCTQQNK